MFYALLYRGLYARPMNMLLLHMYRYNTIKMKQSESLAQHICCQRYRGFINSPGALQMPVPKGFVKPLAWIICNAPYLGQSTQEGGFAKHFTWAFHGAPRGFRKPLDWVLHNAPRDFTDPLGKELWCFLKSLT